MTKGTMFFFSKREIIKSIAQATDSTTGPDEIHCQILKHLPDVSIELLLLLLNNLCSTVVVVNHCFTSLFGTNGLLSDIVI